MDNSLELNAYLIDIVRAVQGVERGQDPQVQLVTYKVLAKDASQAIQRFFNEEAGVIIYEGEAVDSILTGIELEAPIG